jgi:hypothetical protein
MVPHLPADSNKLELKKVPGPWLELERLSGTPGMGSQNY